MGKLIDGLRPARAAARITQAEMAELLGWGPSGGAHVSRVERGERGTDPDTVERWYLACGVQIVLASGDEHPAAIGEEILRSGQLELVRKVATVLPLLDPILLDRFKADVDWMVDRFCHKTS